MILLNKLLRISFILLFLFVPLLVYPNTSELFEFNKIIFIYLITIIVGFLWVLKMIFNKKIEIKRSFIDIPIIIFYLSQVISTIFSIDRHTSLFGYYGRFNGGLVSLSAYLLLFYAFISNFNKPEVFKLLKVSLISSFVVILWGLPGKFGFDLSCLFFAGQFNNSCWTDQFHPELRMFSTLGQPNWLGAYLAISFFIGLYFYFKSIKNNHSRNSILYTLYLILNFLGILFTRSRSAYFALGVGLAIFGAVGYFQFKEILLKSGLKKLGISLGIVIILIVIFKTGIPKVDKFLVFPAIARKPVTAPATNDKLNITESFDIRKIVWKGALDLGLKYPLFGTGVETFAYSYYFTRPVEHNLTSEWDFLYNKAHNEYLNYFATTGFVGIISYLIFIGAVILYFFRLVVRNSKDKQSLNLMLVSCLFMGWLTILITNFFGFSVTTVNIFFYLIPAFVVVLLDDNNRSLLFDLKIKQSKLYVVSGLIVLYLLLATFAYWLADTKYALANKYSQVDDYKTATQLLLQAVQLRGEHVYQDRLSYAIANLAYVASYGKDQKQIDELIKLSGQYNDKSLASSPKNVLYWKTKAKDQYLFYSATLKPDYIKTGVDALIKAEKIAPTDPKNYYSLAIYYSILYDEASDTKEKEKYESLSLLSLAQMIKLKPDYVEGLSLQKQLVEKYSKSLK